MDRGEQVVKALNRLAKWRMVFTGWQLGTRPDTDPEAQALRDHRDQSLIARVELSAVTALLVEKGVFTLEEFHIQLLDETAAMEKMLEERFPGFRSSDVGMQIFDPQKANETTKGWKP